MTMTIEATIALFASLGACGGLFFYLIRKGERESGKKKDN